MSSYPMYPQKVLFATVSCPPVQGIFHGKLAVRIIFLFDDSSTNVCFITKTHHIKTMYSWVNVNSFADLVGKRFGIQVHEELGFICDIFKEDLSDNFCIYD